MTVLYSHTSMQCICRMRTIAFCSNGRLDPWSGGGVTASLSDTLVAITIADGAHHLDLRGWNPSDPPSVIAARKQEKEIVKGWIRNGQHKMIVSHLGCMDSNCNGVPFNHRLK